MNTAEILLAVCFWTCAGGVFYTYLAYPVLIWATSRLFGRAHTPPERSDAELPRVALLIAAHNEAAVIEDRIRNALALSYPRDRLEIVVASDGSDDGTDEICRRYEGRIRALLFPNRRGKAATLNAAMEQLDAEIIAFSDANTFMEPNALRGMTRWFADPRTGAVCGRLVLSDSPTSGSGDGLYWRYETFLKMCEARLGALLGANGAIYAIRRELFTPLPSGTLVDDFLIPLLAKLRSGCRIVYDREAVAHEETAPGLGAEFRRRARIGSGGAQALGMLWPLLSPRHGWTALAFWSHKVLRWACPFFLVGALPGSVLLAGEPLYRAALGAQMFFYALCLFGAALPPGARAKRPLRVFPMFAGMNLALLVGIVRGLRRQQSGIWNRTSRITSDAGAGVGCQGKA
jgi:cellulose synthase/poly-beta-1,6-N-acetylglucosamine synthase-like glycosyltransferase